jgi:hypothetical protein
LIPETSSAARAALTPDATGRLPASRPLVRNLATS